jgi:hypothetical protein
MAKCAIAYVSSVYGSVASSGAAVVFTPAQNPDHTPVKDTRK